NDGSHTISAVARDVAGNTSDLASISSSTFTVANLDTTPPNPPTSLSGATTQPTSSTAAKVTLSWPAASDVITNASGVKGYYVYRGTMVISPLVAGTSYTDINVPTGSLSYTVRSVDNAGLTSTTTSPAYATTINVPVDTTAPTIPTNVTATAVSSSQINLVWSPSSDTGGSGLRGYNIYRNGSTTPHNTIPLTATSYGDASGLSPSTTYSYTVEAVDNAGNKSPKTVAVSVSTAGTTSADVTPPSVAWVVPAPGDTVRGTLNEDNGNCRATATDSSGIAKVEFYLDGRLTNTEVSDPYSCIIDVRRYSRGWHTIGVQAFDNAGNVSPRVSEEVRFR
ncbi:MAG TPA: Ig-like domain-containing protein, partial [Candidatus Saccharimonadia bacterium]